MLGKTNFSNRNYIASCARSALGNKMAAPTRRSGKGAWILRAVDSQTGLPGYLRGLPVLPNLLNRT